VSWLDAEATLVMHVLRDLLHIAEASRGRCGHSVPDIAAVGLDIALTSGADTDTL
jgi:hypothetical protein